MLCDPMSPAGAARAKFAGKVREYREPGFWFRFEMWLIDAEEWFTRIGAIFIALLVFGLPVYLMIADHVSLLNILSGP